MFKDGNTIRVWLLKKEKEKEGTIRGPALPGKGRRESGNRPEAKLKRSNVWTTKYGQTEKGGKVLRERPREFKAEGGQKLPRGERGSWQSIRMDPLKVGIENNKRENSTRGQGKTSDGFAQLQKRSERRKEENCI